LVNNPLLRMLRNVTKDLIFASRRLRMFENKIFVSKTEVKENEENYIIRTFIILTLHQIRLR